MGEIRNSGIASDCSNDSYQSAASVRLEKEVNQLHLFYNEKALTIEEKLKNSFHVCFSSYYNFVRLIVDYHFFLYYSIFFSSSFLRLSALNEEVLYVGFERNFRKVVFSLPVWEIDH